MMKSAEADRGKSPMKAWAEAYRTWEVISGYVLSPSHGNRIVRSHANPPEAAEIYRFNAVRRLERRSDYRSYPEGTTIIQRSWRQGPDGAPGEPGPVFFMHKEAPGYDPDGGDWRYGLARPDFSVIGEGFDKETAFCKECHAQVRDRDFLYSVDR